MKKIILLALVAALAGSALALDVKTDTKQPYPTIKFSGWFKAVYFDTLYHDSLVTYPSGFEAKDAAVTVSGDAWQDLSYKLCLQYNKATKAGTSTVYAPWLYDAYAEWKPSKLYSFRVGQYKRPFGCEQLLAATAIDFVTAAQITGKFNSSNRDQGVMLFGVWKDISYNLSLGNGAPYNEKDANTSKTVVSRIVYPPLAGMTVGGSVEYGTQNVAGTKSYYNRHAGLDVNYEWGKLFARGEFMIGLDDKSLLDSLYLTTAMTISDTIPGGYMDTAGTWHDTTYYYTRTINTKTYTKVSDVTSKLMRGGYITVGYVPMKNLKINARGDLYREYYTWKLDTVRVSTTELDTVWSRTEARTFNWTIGVDYFLNPNTKFSVNYDIKQEDLALRPKKNNVLAAQLQVKF
jgi:phosphate-selective porin